MQTAIRARQTPWTAAACLVVALPGGAAYAEPRAASQPDPPTSGAAALPESEAGRRVDAFFDSINAADPAAYEAFNQEHRTEAALARATPERRAAQYAEFTRLFSNLRIERVFEEPGSLVVFTETRRGESLMFAFEIDESQGAKIGGLRIEPGVAHLYAIERSAAWSEWASLAELFAAVREGTGIPAVAAAVVRGGQIVDAATVGVTRFGADTPVGPDARFHWGSVNKSLTATAIASLVERGDLSWDTTIGETFPDLEMLDAYRGATLRQLLSHTAGFPQYTLIVGNDARRMFAYEGSPVDKRRAFARDLLREAPLFQPGQGFAYSNAGYGLAAHMAETITGQAWEDLIAGAVFGPLGLETAGLGLPSGISDEEPVGHHGMGPRFTPTEGGVPDLPPIWPAGNVHSDIEDLAAYAAFHLAGLRGQDGALKAETVEFLHEPAPGTEGQAGGGYALGWSIQDWEGVSTHAHNGSAGTYFATVRLFPELDLAIVTLMNAGGPGDVLAEKLERAIFERFAGQAAGGAASP